MLLRRLLAVAAGVALVGLVSDRASAQNEAPFTIRRPPDGATVREKVRVQIPRTSIPEGGYISFYIDGQFHVAVTPPAIDRSKIKPGDLYTFIWDTKKPMKVKGSPKAMMPEDGEHAIEARLYAPKASTLGGSDLKETSAVQVKLANKAVGDPGPVRLRYRYSNGDTRTYNRTGDTSIVVGLTQGLRGTGDQELVSQRSQVQLSVEDVYAQGSAILRNKLKSLRVRQGGQETYYPAEQLPKSLYQELDPFGHVLYQNDTISFDQFAQLGVPVSTTIDLPILPLQPVKVGDTWTTDNVKLDIPGTSPDRQPKVRVTSTFEGVEWEGGYPTAKIRQTYDSSTGGLQEKSITFGTIQVDNPQLKFERDIYIAYRSGRLIKMVRTLEVTGKTSQSVAPSAGAAPGMMMGGGMPGMMGGMMSGPPPGVMGGIPGMRGGPPGGAMMSGPPPGVMSGGRGGRGGRGSMMSGPPGGAMGGAMGGYMSMMSGGRRGGQRSAPGSSGMSMSGMPPGAMMGGRMGGAARGGFAGAGGTQPQAQQQITLKSTTVTELVPSGSRTASAR
jgi:hypothetical protein